MIAERIKELRQRYGYTQTDLANLLHISRASVNAWEMGISIPSTQFIIELSKLFDVSSDFLLGLKKTTTLNAEGLTEKEIELLNELISMLKMKSKIN